MSRPSAYSSGSISTASTCAAPSDRAIATSLPLPEPMIRTFVQRVVRRARVRLEAEGLIDPMNVERHDALVRPAVDADADAAIGRACVVVMRWYGDQNVRGANDSIPSTTRTTASGARSHGRERSISATQTATTTDPQASGGARRTTAPRTPRSRGCCPGCRAGRRRAHRTGRTGAPPPARSPPSPRTTSTKISGSEIPFGTAGHPNRPRPAGRRRRARPRPGRQQEQQDRGQGQRREAEEVARLATQESHADPRKLASRMKLVKKER